ncbi:MAG: helix-turn-helix domain-containing protein [Agathobacter sp.]
MLDKIMRDKKITSRELAEKTGIPKRTIDDYRGSRKKEPSLSRGIKIADALGIDPRDLIKK